MIIRNSRELGHLVKRSRRKRGLTQALLATHVGASRKWIIDLEAGKRTSDLSLVLQTLNALGLELDARERAKRPPALHDLDAIVDASKRSRHE